MAIDPILLFLDFLQKELLLFASLCFLIGSIDDLVFDGMWIVHRLKRKFFVYSRHERATAESLKGSKSGRRLAIFVPAWQEAPVIGAMLQRCLQQWTSTEYRIYVGCYPNDSETVAAVATACSGTAKVRLVICHNNGPTTKA
ncbi:glycosyltransferase, partial [Parasphingorhabdus sp.]